MLLWMFCICEHDDQQNVVSLCRREIRVEARGGPSTTQWLRLEMQMFSPGEMVVPNGNPEPVMSQRLWRKKNKEGGSRVQGCGVWGVVRTKLDGGDGSPGLERTWRG